MILVDLNESYQNIPKLEYTLHYPDKSAIFMGLKIAFFFFAPKMYLSQGKPCKKN
jgi:hypothetical protein